MLRIYDFLPELKLEQKIQKILIEYKQIIYWIINEYIYLKCSITYHKGQSFIGVDSFIRRSIGN